MQSIISTFTCISDSFYYRLGKEELTDIEYERRKKKLNGMISRKLLNMRAADAEKNKKKAQESNLIAEQ